MKTLYPSPPVARKVCNLTSLRGFSLLELLVVIGLIGLLTSIAIPAFKGFGQSNKLISAQRQIGDDIGLARAFAIKNRTPVFMVFLAQPNLEDGPAPRVPLPSALANNHQQWISLQANSQIAPLAQLALRTFTNAYTTLNASYAFYVEQTIGDQPGVQRKRFLSFSGNIWKSLPDGIIFAPNMRPIVSLNNAMTNLAVRKVPFPIADQLPGMVPTTFDWPSMNLPVLAFDSQGRLVEVNSNTGNLQASATRKDRFLALGLGTTILPRQPVFDTPGSGVRIQATEFDFGGSFDVLETPKANYTNSFYRVSALTGRVKRQTWPLY